MDVSAPLRFGFIGCGKVSAFHADVVLALGHQVDCACGREGSANLGEFARKYGLGQRFSSWQDMVVERRPDALVVAVSWDQTERVISDVIQAGIPCLVEKPIALSSSKLEQILGKTEPWHSQVLVAYNRRFYDFIPQLKAAIQADRLISIDLKFPEATQRLVQAHSKAIAEHILVYMSSHWFDLLHYLLGGLAVECVVRPRQVSAGVVESVNGMLTSLADRTPIHIQGNFNTPANTSLTFNFSQRIYELRPIEQMTVFEGMTVERETLEIPIKRYMPRVKETFYVDTAHKPGFLGQMSNFIDTCVRKTTSNTVGCTLYDAVAVTRLCEEIKRKSSPMPA